MNKAILKTALVPALVLILAAEALAQSVSIPKTGQVISYSFGDDGDLQNGVAWPTPRFTDHGDETVTDHLTGLVWTQDAFLSGEMIPWIAALEFVADMNAGIHPNYGHVDWRLPNINELESLLDYGQIQGALPAGHPFNNVQGSITQSVQNVYWSSTTVLNFFGQAVEALAKSMTNARTMDISHTDLTGALVWPVRGPDQAGRISLPRTGWTTAVAPGDDGSLQRGVAWPSPRLVDNGDGTVNDKLTGLMWTKSANFGQATWQDALDFIMQMNAGVVPNFGHTDWRLPNTREQRSLVDNGHSRPPLPGGGADFLHVQLATYWTSTAWSVSDPSQKAVVSMNFARDVYFFTNSADSNFFWPVRGVTAAPVLACAGFQSPMDKGPVTVRKNRALPLRAHLFDEDNFPVSDTDILASPVIQIEFASSTGAAAVDVTDHAFPAGDGTDGNQFVFVGGAWRFNLKTRTHTAAGTYTITMVSGDETEYLINPTCEAAFVIE